MLDGLILFFALSLLSFLILTVLLLLFLLFYQATLHYLVNKIIQVSILTTRSHSSLSS